MKASGMLEGNVESIVRWIDIAAKSVHENAVEKGFYDHVDEDDTLQMLGKLCLVHTEVSELAEAIRTGGDARASEKIGPFTEEEEELADVIIRLLDYGSARHLNVGRAVVTKMLYNEGRELMHGKRA